MSIISTVKVGGYNCGIKEQIFNHSLNVCSQKKTRKLSGTSRVLANQEDITEMVVVRESVFHADVHL